MSTRISQEAKNLPKAISFEIEKHSPMPDGRKDRWRGFIRAFIKLEDGECIKFSGSQSECILLQQRLCSGPLKHFVGKYITRKSNDGLRVWKIARKENQ